MRVLLLCFLVSACDTQNTGKAVIPNNLPTTPEITLTPENPSSLDDLVVGIITPSTDVDGDPVEYLVEWQVDGETVDGVDTLTLEHIFTRRGESWTAVVTAFDGIAGGGSTSRTVTVVNSRPVVEAITITPSSIYEASLVECIYDEPTDADNDVVQQLQVWAVNGVELDVRGTLDGNHFDKGDSIECLVYADDGVAELEPLRSAASIVLNTTPHVIGCLLERNDLPQSDDVYAFSTGWIDEDGDPEAYRYQWYLNWDPVSTEEFLSADLLNVGDNVFVEMTAWDGETDGNTVRSDYGTGID
jgi:hypothetical protein